MGTGAFGAVVAGSGEGTVGAGQDWAWFGERWTWFGEVAGKNKGRKNGLCGVCVGTRGGVGQDWAGGGYFPNIARPLCQPVKFAWRPSAAVALCSKGV